MKQSNRTMGAHYFLIYRHCLCELGFGLASGLGLGFTRDRCTVVVAVAVIAVVLIIDLNKSGCEQVKSSRHSRCY